MPDSIMSELLDDAQIRVVVETGDREPKGEIAATAAVHEEVGKVAILGDRLPADPRIRPLAGFEFGTAAPQNAFAIAEDHA